MELYAAMLDNLDRHIGRLLGDLRARGLYDDTLIIFMSDNGAAGEDFYYQGPPVLTNYIREHYNDDYDQMGRPESFISYGPQWAQAGAAPFRLYKGFPTEGGLLAPMIVAGPGVGWRAEKTDTYLTVMDLAPTLLDIADATYPADKAPMLGESARAFLAGSADRVHADDYVMTMSYSAAGYSQRTFIRQGPWKLVTFQEPFDERNFELINVVDDPAEMTDLSSVLPERRQAMIDLWRAERRKLGIILPEDL
jgi:arylsulfatase